MVSISVTESGLIQRCQLSVQCHTASKQHEDYAAQVLQRSLSRQLCLLWGARAIADNQYKCVDMSQFPRVHIIIIFSLITITYVHNALEFGSDFPAITSHALGRKYNQRYSFWSRTDIILISWFCHIIAA